MKILIPPHRKQSAPVTSTEQLADAAGLRELINGTFNVGLYKDGFALAHSQVSDEPFSFFVVHERFKPAFKGQDVIVNAKILEREDEFTFDREACLSFPFRQPVRRKRFNRVAIAFAFPRGNKLVHVPYLELEGVPALIAQHEVDHAHGKLLF